MSSLALYWEPASQKKFMLLYSRKFSVLQYRKKWHDCTNLNPCEVQSHAEISIVTPTNLDIIWSVVLSVYVATKFQDNIF